ncbi:MAG: oligosaccharide flippase family protein, partial [bacterium]
MSDSDDVFDVTSVKDDLKDNTIRGGFYTVGGRFFTIVVQAVGIMAMARLLLPKHFGLVAMVSPFIAYAKTFQDLGLGEVIMQRDDLEHGQVSNLFWINAVVSLVLALIFMIGSPLITMFYSEPKLYEVVIFFSAGLFLEGLTVEHEAILKRQMRFGWLAFTDVGSTACSIIAGIATALYVPNVLALLIMAIFKSATKMLLLWAVTGWFPSLPSFSSQIKSLIQFGGNLTGFATVNFLSRQFDDVLIGKRWGATPLGFYSKAYQLLLLP